MSQIEQVWAFFAIVDGEENLLGMPNGSGGQLPMVTSSEENLKIMMRIAGIFASTKGMTVRLVKFGKREEIVDIGKQPS
jgi:hypothetical protein